jgi:oligopeptide/dipeptide ABC transporter ATP-binding protein
LTPEPEGVLRVDELTVTFPDARGGDVTVVDRLSLEVSRGEALGVLGESGSGKTVTALSLMGLLPFPGRLSGSVRLLGHELVGMDEADWSRVRGRDVSMVFPDARRSLNPVRSVGSQIEEAVRRHYEGFPHGAMGRWVRERALEALAEAGVAAPRQPFRSYPHELVGDLPQRVMVALASANHPPLFVTDEPTAGLESPVQAQVMLHLLRRLLKESALLVLTRNPAVATAVCRRVVVLHQGRVVESGPTDVVLTSPRHPYTATLLDPRRRQDSPILAQAPIGCAYSPRCPNVMEHCLRVRPPLDPIHERLVACWNPLESEAS